MWATFQEPTLIRHGFAVPPSPLEGEGLRAVRYAAPTGWNGSFKAGDRKGRPYGFSMEYLTMDGRV